MSKSLIIAVGLLILVVSGLAYVVINSLSQSPKVIPIVDLSNIRVVGVPTINANDPLERGEVAYNTFCAHCHGYSGEGEGAEVDASLPDTLGYMPVPRHDNKGHTWMHPDGIIIAAVRQGLPSPLYRYPMPAFSPEALSEAQMADILLYIKQWWTPEQRAAQAALTKRHTEALNSLSPLATVQHAPHATMSTPTSVP
jgi:mono/diheme cytochrome c family protein